jgi:microcystin-dependent protein
MSIFNNFLSTAKGFGAVAALAIGFSGPAQQASAGPNPMLGDMMQVGFNFCPRGWALADGQILPINTNQSLYSLLGTTYGGDGRTSFALPDLRGRSPIGYGTGNTGLPNYLWGQHGGTQTNIMTTVTMPAHNHPVNASNTQATKFGPGGDYLADPADSDLAEDLLIYSDSTDATNKWVMKNTMLTQTGGGQAFPVLEPFLAMNWCIALQGVFPSRN